MGEKNEKNSIHTGHRERVRNGVAEHGFQQLEDHKLLELLLFYSIPRGDTNELAHRLLNEFGGISGVLGASCEELMRVDGVGRNTAVMLNSVSEICSRAARDRFSQKKKFGKFQDIADYAKALYVNETKEKVYLLFLDAAKRLKCTRELTVGDETAASIDKSLVARLVVQNDCKYNILVHNHPASDCSPSAADIDTTRSIAVMLRNMGFSLADHIIVGAEGDVFSMYLDPNCKTFLY